PLALSSLIASPPPTQDAPRLRTRSVIDTARAHSAGRSSLQPETSCTAENALLHLTVRSGAIIRLSPVRAVSDAASSGSLRCSRPLRFRPSTLSAARVLPRHVTGIDKRVDAAARKRAPVAFHAALELRRADAVPAAIAVVVTGTSRRHVRRLSANRCPG